jgi:hypothetical protein
MVKNVVELLIGIAAVVVVVVVVAAAAAAYLVMVVMKEKVEIYYLNQLKIVVVDQ